MLKVRSRCLASTKGDVEPLARGDCRGLTRRAARREIPSGLAMSGDGKRLYVCGNLSNRLLELDATTGKMLRTFAWAWRRTMWCLLVIKAVVSNWGGRRPGAGDLTGPAGRGTRCGWIPC